MKTEKTFTVQMVKKGRVLKTISKAAYSINKLNKVKILRGEVMKNQNRILLFLVIGLLVLTLTMGCNGQKTEPAKNNKEADVQNEMLAKVLPNRTGFNFVYNGFAEYGHQLKLTSIEKGKDKTIYTLSGSIDDLSGGESKGDFSLEVVYTIKDDVLYQSVQGRMMDTIPEMELLRAPLDTGTRWEQTVENKEGKKYQLECIIAEVKEVESRKVYTVTYKDKKSDFYEKRVFEEGYGVVSFETLLKSKEDTFTIGYSLYKERSGLGEKIELNAYLPPLSKPLRYFGLAEYGHTGILSLVNEGQDKAEYQFKGTFQDGTGIPGEFVIKYIFNYQDGTVQEKVIRNTREKINEVNSKLHDPILIKLPLQVGNMWQQDVTFEGQKKLMTAKIVSISYEGRTFHSQMKKAHPVMTIRYMVEDVDGYFQNTYVEERRYEKGLGMIGFSQLTKGDLGITEKDDEYKIENAIINNMFGYSLAQE